MKRNLASGQGIGYSIFNGDKLTQNDVDAIINYANAVKSGVKPAIAMKENLKGCSVAGLQYVKTAKKTGQSTNEMVAGLKEVPKVTNAASIGIKALSIAGNILFSMGIAMAISGLIKGIDYLIHREEKLQEALDESISEFNETTSEIKVLEDQITLITEKIEALQKLKDTGTISIADEKELENLKEENEELARNLALKQAKQVGDAKEALKKAKKTSNSTHGSNYGYLVNNDSRYKGFTGLARVTSDEELLLAIQAFNNGDKSESTANRIQDMYEDISPTLDAYRDLIDAGVELEGQDKETYERLKKAEDAYLMYSYAITGTKTAFEGLTKEQKRNVLIARLTEGGFGKSPDGTALGMSEEYAKAIVNSIQDEDLNKYFDADFSFKTPIPFDFKSAEEFGEAYAKAWLNSIKETMDEDSNGIDDLLKNTTKTLSALQSKYGELQSAQEEYNSTGAISAETMQKLIDNNLLQYLDYSSGKLKINTNALLAEGEAAKVNAIQKLQDAMATDLMNLATGKTDELSNTAQTAIANLGNTAETTGGKAETAASKLAGFALAAQAAKDGAQGKLNAGFSVEDFNTQANAIISAYTQTANLIGNINIKSPTSGGGKNEDTKETFNWLETAISRLQRSITNFGKTVSATWKSWAERNSALKSQISEVTKEIDLQQQAADKYWALAESVTGVGNYKELIQNGALDISTVTNEDDINAIKQYQEYYEAYLAALDAKQDAEDELANLVREDFNMIAKQFDSEISLVEANMGIIEAYIDQAEMKGNLVSKNYYSAMSAEEEKNLSFLQQKYKQLSNALRNGTIKQGSEEWNSMSVEIKEVNKAIIESNTKLEEYQKTMRELDWEAFDLIQDKIGNVTEESEFLIDLLSKSKLFNEDGSITSQGQATLGLHVANMKIYESQISDYAQAIKDLDNQFANDPLDQNYLERRQELVESQKDAILNCQNEKDSMKDLMNEGYDNLLSYMDKLISKRKDLLSQASDARSFQKTVKEQTDEIARLQNIIGSYGGSLSEEDKAIVQKHQVSLESAQEDLEDTLYDQYISDTEKMLDLLVEDTESIISTRLDDTDELVSDVVQKTEENTDAIKETLVSEVSNVGGTISTAMNTLWSDNISGVVGGVSTTLTEIKELVGKMVKGSDTEANQNTSDATSDVTPATTPVSTPQENPTSTQQSTEKEITVGGLINASGALIYSNANGGGGSRQYYRANPIYTVLSERNGFLKVRHQSLSSGTTGWFKKSDVKAYKTGGLVDYTGLAWVDGQKGRPEAFLNANDTELFAKLKDSLEIVSKTNMFDAIQSYTKIPNFVTNGSINNSGGDIIFEKIEMYGVNDPQEFAKQLKEVYDRDIGNVRKMINTDVHSKYGSMNYRRYL